MHCLRLCVLLKNKQLLHLSFKYDMTINHVCIRLHYTCEFKGLYKSSWPVNDSIIKKNNPTKYIS